ncbi:nicotinate-nucleotide adenylyltransferase [Mediterraneibacter agrestimuris]|uniref:nicotinate-nucleotide adenylyltransferase n=1 Tax=Mediterraneibacter agrestimuris TaxID=2941333 RepID=UPI00203F0537|nr:nicotinate-nucleotide adenylyltransferase [Mediterraneibacter agrestimuris]
MKIGIMGGTFDPIHIGHLLLGQFAYEDFGLDQIWYLPNGNPPHKQTEEGTKALRHRIEMVRLAIQDMPYFKLCLLEAKETEHSYTYKTMRELNAQYPEHKFYFILGADSLFEIENWKYFREIFPTCTILAAMRDDKNVEKMLAQMTHLVEQYGAEIELLRAPLLEISSTAIRSRARNNLSVYYMVPDTVAEYIVKNELYQMRG